MKEAKLPEYLLAAGAEYDAAKLELQHATFKYEVSKLEAKCGELDTSLINVTNVLEERIILEVGSNDDVVMHSNEILNEYVSEYRFRLQENVEKVKTDMLNKSLILLQLTTLTEKSYNEELAKQVLEKVVPAREFNLSGPVKNLIRKMDKKPVKVNSELLNFDTKTIFIKIRDLGTFTLSTDHRTLSSRTEEGATTFKKATATKALLDQIYEARRQREGWQEHAGAEIWKERLGKIESKEKINVKTDFYRLENTYIDNNFKKVAGPNFDKIVKSYNNTKACFFNTKTKDQQTSQRLQDLSYGQRQLIIYTDHATSSHTDWEFFTSDTQARA